MSGPCKLLLAIAVAGTLGGLATGWWWMFTIPIAATFTASLVDPDARWQRARAYRRAQRELIEQTTNQRAALAAAMEIVALAELQIRGEQCEIPGLYSDDGGPERFPE